MSPSPRARRDPEARRLAIVSAAVDVIVEDGINALTHRKVAARAQVPLGSTTQYFATLDDLKEAALERLAGVVDEGLDDLARRLSASDDVARTLARAVHEYLCDPVLVRADAAFYVASTENPTLRPLAARWFDGLVGLLSERTDPATAQLLAVHGDGAHVYALLHDGPPSEDDLTDGFARLLAGASR